jgi:ketose-bisphosphate aldolase
MPLVSLQTLLAQAVKDAYAVGYFEAWDSYSVEAVVEAAEAEQAPVILGFGCMMVAPHWLDAGGIEMLGSFGRAKAERAHIPVALILNEARTFEQAQRAVAAGFNSIMLDTSAWDWARAVEAVARLVRFAHAHGAAVEGELGRLPDAVEDRIDESSMMLTDPDQAAAFVHATGVDCLAVSVGNVHLLTTHVAPVNLTQLEKIHQRVSLPLVIHGGTSFPPDLVPAAIARGVAKFNVGTILKQKFLEGLREAVGSLPTRVNVHALLGSHNEIDLMNAGKARMSAKVRELIRLYGASGRAAEFFCASETIPERG